jgi:hypothetical protein
VIASGGVLVFWFARRHGVNLGIAALRALQPPREEPLPRRWSVAPSFLIPNYCAAPPALGFSANHHLEATYRASGIAAGLLPSRAYVRFSQPWLAAAIADFCQSGAEPTFCVPAVDDLLAWSGRFALLRALAPEGAEPPTPALNCTVAPAVSAGGVTATKRLLLSTESPLILSLPRLRKRFPDNRSFDVDSDFVPDGLSVLAPGPRNSVPLVGYNDFAAGGSRGGLIVRNNWGAVGHSIEYLLGQISLDMDRRLCPNARDPALWVPATVECANRSARLENCSRDLAVVYENATAGARELTCVNETFCKMGPRYVLLRGNDEQTPVVIEIGEEGLKKRDIALPREFLFYAFLPKVAPVSSYEHCGYVLLPYTMLRQLAGMRGDGTDGWRAFAINVTWENGSFVGSNRPFNYSGLSQSTYTVPPIPTQLTEFVYL